MLGQMPDFSEGMDFLKTMWGNVGMPSGLMSGLQGAVPGFAMPPMDLEDLDKRITDLKSVESWLSLNLNLLRTTIQGLEVQRATLVALKTFAGAMSMDQVREAMEKQAAAHGAPAAAPAEGQAHPFATSFPVPPAPAAAQEAHQGLDADEQDVKQDVKQAGSPQGDGSRPVGAAAGTDSTTPGQAGTDAAAAAAAQAGAWWNVLHDQFNQIANSAVNASQLGKSLEPVMTPLREAAGAIADVVRGEPVAAKPGTKARAAASAKSTSAARKTAAEKPAGGKASGGKAAAKKPASKAPAEKAATAKTGLTPGRAGKAGS